MITHNYVYLHYHQKKMLQSLTTKQQKVMKYYRDYIEKHSYPPTYQQAADDLWISPSVVHNHVKNIKKLGYMTNNPTWDVALSAPLKKVPLVGAVACGEPIDVYESVDDHIDLPKSMLKWIGPFYALKAQWRSMINVWINDGDTLIIGKQQAVNDGDIAVVVMKNDGDESATLKRVFRKPLSIVLKAENDGFPNAVLTWWDVEIRGKLINVIRQYSN